MNEVPSGIDGEIELFDLGDVTVETKQWSEWPIWFDSVFLLGEKELG